MRNRVREIQARAELVARRAAPVVLALFALAAPASAQVPVQFPPIFVVPSSGLPPQVRVDNSSGAAAVTLSVDLAHPGSQLPTDYTGLSLEANELSQRWLDPSHGNLLALLGNLHPASLRFGGDSVDDTAWSAAPSSPRPTWAAGEITPDDLARLGRLARVARWQVDLGVNLARFDPAAAASEARTAVSAIGSPLRSIQIGNEPDTYFYNRPQRPYVYENYLPDEQAYRSAIAAAAPSVSITGPDTAAKPLNIAAGAAYMRLYVVGQWLSPYARDHRTQARSLNQHLYPLTSCLGAAGDPTIDELLSPGLAEQTRSMIDAIVAAGRPYQMPVHLDEANSISCGGQPGVSNSFASALWLVDFLLMSAREGVAQVNLHGSGGVCTGYAPLCFPNPAASASGQLSAQPEYYGALLVSRLEGGSFLPTSFSDNSHNLVAYALLHGAKLQIVLLNLERGFAGRVSARVPVAARTATVQRLTAPSLDSIDGVRFGGAAVTPTGQFHPARALQLPIHRGQLNVTLPAASATLVTIRLRPGEPGRAASGDVGKTCCRRAKRAG